MFNMFSSVASLAPTLSPVLISCTSLCREILLLGGTYSNMDQRIATQIMFYTVFIYKQMYFRFGHSPEFQ